MIEDNKFVCSDFPQYEIKWGLITQKSEEEIKEWIKDNVRILCASLMSGVKDIKKFPSLVGTLADEIYDNICQVGYEEGYDAHENDESI
ncbi:MAG: hypothetical protein J6Y78_09685 [Paludibacteraceae bacterium]|nr:hypothetical protein [Paludibacteraceae bacterium]